MQPGIRNLLSYLMAVVLVLSPLMPGVALSADVEARMIQVAEASVDQDHSVHDMDQHESELNCERGCSDCSDRSQCGSAALISQERPWATPPLETSLERVSQRHSSLLPVPDPYPPRRS